MTDLNDPSKIVPRAIQHARVSPVNFAIRTMVDYDVNFLTDRLRSDIFIDGKYAGVYSAMHLPDEIHGDEAIATFGAELERGVIDEFMGLGYRKTVRALEVEVKALRDFIERDRWFHFRPLRRRAAEYRLRVLNAWDMLKGKPTDYHHADL